MIAYLTKSDASEGFNQIIDFLNESSIKYALTVNPNIYVSCIKQFWTTVAVKKVNDVTWLQALVDKKKVVVTEATIRDALRLDDAEGVECLHNEEIFAELARMGYEKPSTKLTFYKAFFSSQWKVGGVGDGIDGSSLAVGTTSSTALTTPSVATPAAGTPSSCTSSATPLPTSCATTMPSKSSVSTPENPLPTCLIFLNTFWVRAREVYFMLKFLPEDKQMTADAIDELNSFQDVRLALIH
nr:xylulose kinase-1 [Tanacetum cinerariifolium]